MTNGATCRHSWKTTFLDNAVSAHHIILPFNDFTSDGLRENIFARKFACSTEVSAY